MKKRYFILLLSLLCPIGVCCQMVNNVCDEFGVIYMPVNDSTIIYNTKKGKKYEVKLNKVYYVDGEDNLKKYLKERYSLFDNSDDYAYRVFFFMLFDSNLKIKEIRGVVLPLSHYTKTNKKRIKQYMKGLKRTKNRWLKKSNQNWFVYSFSFVTD